MAGSRSETSRPVDTRHADGAFHERRSSIEGATQADTGPNRYFQATITKPSLVAHRRRSILADRLSGLAGSFHRQSGSSSRASIVGLTLSGGQGPRMTAVSSVKVQTFSKGTESSQPSSYAMVSDSSTSSIKPAASFEDRATTELPRTTYAYTNNDYFGQQWGSVSPSRAGAVGPARSPSSPYSPGATRSQIQPGAKNSFAKPVITRSVTPLEDAKVSNSRTNIPDSNQGSHAMNDIGRSDGEDQVGSRNVAPANQIQGERVRRKRAPSQKAMLSKALQKANHAVVLDNAQNFEGATEAYNDACDLLQQVMMRSSTDEDRRKLDAIRNTYRNRIKELQSNELSTYHIHDKALPDVPLGGDTRDRDHFSPATDDDDEPATELAVNTIANPAQQPRSTSTLQHSVSQERIPPRRQSLMLSGSSGEQPQATSILEQRVPEHPNSWKLELEKELTVPSAPAQIPAPMRKDYMPPPLSPRRPLSPKLQPSNIGVSEEDKTHTAPHHITHNHSRQATAESTSWLDTIDESGGSSNSSVHSRSSSIGLRRKHIRTGSGATEAEFDAALDAAVEAAYDDGYEPMSDNDNDDDDDVDPYRAPSVTSPDAYFASVKKNIDLAKQRVRDAEREAAIVIAREHEKRRRLEQNDGTSTADVFRVIGDDRDAEQEERMLEELTQDFILDNSDDVRPQSKISLPRKSDSSNVSGRTFGSSVGSAPLTAATTLSTVAENGTLMTDTSSLVQSKSHVEPFSGFPASLAGTLGNLQNASVPSPANVISTFSSPGVRERRLSGQKVKQLKIDTTAKLPLGLSGPKTQPLPPFSNLADARTFDDAPKSASLPIESFENASNIETHQDQLRAPLTSPRPGADPPGGAFTSLQPRSEAMDAPTSLSPGKVPSKVSSAGTLRKNYSSSSLKSLRQQIPTPSATEESPGTPISRVFSSSSVSHRNDTLPLPDLPTPAVANFAKHGLLAGGLSFFDSDIHSPLTPGSPNNAVTNAPVPLEYCPESFLLRPFWLMRAIYQTIAHPRGGYISTRLFIPRDAWRVKNVKLKNVDEKVANCDLLTAALLNLQKVDTLDADAVLEEMQAFELILDQVQGQLGKKLGAEVGVHGSAALFRPSQNVDECLAADGINLKGNGVSGKSYLTSWKRLRSKNSSGPGLPSTVNNPPREGMKDSLTMRSLPMTATTNPRYAKRDAAKVLGIGPHSHYMAALGRLCDAVQILDQIARQVEDPGLRLSSQTHVGLELCIRHAAEFFAFFVCRFALSDIGMMLDKFVKRGSEWVLA